MKLWFQLKSTKEEFDTESRKLMTAEQIHLHNEFLLCLFNKCQGLASFTSRPPVSSKTSFSPSKSTSSALKDKTNRRTKVKKRSRSDKGNFEPADIADYIVPPNALPPHVHEEPLRYSAQELFLPDMPLIFGRMILSAWEVGLDGAEEHAAELLVVGVQHFLKNVLTAILGRRKGYKVREDHFLYAMGSAVPNPWLCNTMNIIDDVAVSLSTNINEAGRMKSPVHNLSLDEIEQKAAYEIACGDVASIAQYPVNAYQVLEALQVHRNVIPSHTVYSVNIERVINTLNHPANEEIEGAM
ncbi:transcriptional adapter 1 isoform X4 [Zootermopsis nevadensis]|nr:transcriptional adapter 1 isoform X4 [Zootermopsis nevadensis]